jgi:hypothetical protein
VGQQRQDRRVPLRLRDQVDERPALHPASRAGVRPYDGAVQFVGAHRAERDLGVAQDFHRLGPPRAVGVEVGAHAQDDTAAAVLGRGGGDQRGEEPGPFLLAATA